jgi:hypothetical protein
MALYDPFLKAHLFNKNINSKFFDPNVNFLDLKILNLALKSKINFLAHDTNRDKTNAL